MRGRRAVIRPFTGTLKELPPPPATLPKAAKKYWTTVAGDVCERGHLVPGMLPTIETLAIAMWTRDQCVKAIEKDGGFVRTKTGEPKPHPAQGILNKTQELIARLSAEFGLTSASRSRKTLKPIDKNGEESKAAWSKMDL